VAGYIGLSMFFVFHVPPPVFSLYSHITGSRADEDTPIY